MLHRYIARNKKPIHIYDNDMKGNIHDIQCNEEIQYILSITIQIQPPTKHTLFSTIQNNI